MSTVLLLLDDDLMDAKPSLLALSPVVRSTPVPMQALDQLPFCGRVGRSYLSVVFNKAAQLSF